MNTTDIVNKRFSDAVDYLISSDVAKNKSAIADALNIGKSKLSEILNNRMNVGVELIVNFCKEFNISVEWLLNGRGGMIDNNTYDPYTSIEGYVVKERDEDFDYHSSKFSDEALKTISNRIAEIYESNGLGIQDFAKKIGYNYSSLMQIIAGKKPVTDSLIIKIAEKFPEVNPIWIFTGKGNLKKDTVDHNMAVDIVPKVVTVDKTGNDNIVMVPVKAAAGYLDGYGDPEFINKLPTYHLPNINHGTYRMFQINGRSMYPTLHDNGFVVGQWVENWYNDIKDDKVYVVVSKSDGVVVKRVLNRLEKYGTLYCKSDNRREYPNFTVETQNIVEVWEVKMALSFELPNPAQLYDRMNDLEAELMHLKSSIKSLNK